MDKHRLEYLNNKARELGPWRYDHRYEDFFIKGDPVAAPIHGDYGHGSEIMRHIVSTIAEQHDISTWRVIDLGCLEGHYTEILCEMGFKEIVAVDLSQEQVNRTKFLLQDVHQFKNVSVYSGSIEDEKFLESLGKYNIVLFHGLLYHMQNPIGIFNIINNISADNAILLLGTQFKFTFLEIVSRSPVANIKFRTIKADSDGKVRYEGTMSTYAPLAMRLNPWAVYKLLEHFGYRYVIGYDTPLGSQYGFQLNVIAERNNEPDLLKKLNNNNTITGLNFYRWNGDSIDGCNFKRNITARITAIIARFAYSMAEHIGKSAKRQDDRKYINRNRE